ncbi:hypothetical protein V5O48_001822 [Marasmius crinis-equi]|uniref:Uncharacterized protein n=1 Tax=Marasmius crinis-equi TaxID=585013 RepID=A0ABR3FXH3_9AGAR
MKDKYQENKNDPLKQLEDYGESDPEVMSDSDAMTPLKKKFTRLYEVHGTNEERRKWKEEHTKMHQLHIAQPTMHDPRMEMFRRDLMMPRMGIQDAEVWEALNREYLRDKAKGGRGEQMESEDDEEDELELDEEKDEERDKKASARGSSDVEDSPARKVHNSRKVKVDRRTRKTRDQEEQKNNTKTKATDADFTILGELSRPGGMSRYKNQPAETRGHKRQRLIDNAQVGERVKRVTRSRTALNTNSTTPFSLKPIPASTLKHHAAPATNNSRYPLPAPTSRTTSSALQPVPEVPPPPPPSNPAQDLNLPVIKRQLEDLCSDFRYGRVDIQSALGRFDGVAARIGRFANAMEGGPA